MLRLRNITKVYQNNTKALENINLDIIDGEKIIIIGASGAGKSSLLKILGLVDLKYQGEYFLDQINLKKLSINQLASLRNSYFANVFQEKLLIDEETVYQNIVLSLKFNSQLKLDQIYFQRLVKLLGIENLLTKKANQLSGGEAQRVMIARSLISKPKIILLDESTSALNPSLATQIIHGIFELANIYHQTLIIVTHDLLRIAIDDFRLIILSKGQIIKNQKYRLKEK